MNNPTDINQASEYELDTVFYKYLGGTPDSDEYQAWLELKQDIQSLIRTEKLNLLAVVREEAFSGGLSFELDDGQIVIEVETDLKSITAKLEAEL